MIQWSPLLFAAATIWAILAWRHNPASFGYFLACFAVGLACGALNVVDLLEDVPPLVHMFWILVFISAPMFIGAILYSDFDAKMNYQYMSVVVASILGVIVVFRRRLMKLASVDAEQSVGPERGERVSQVD